MRNILIAALFFSAQVFAADTIINTNKVKVGQKSSAANKVVEFDINAGAANPKIQVNPSTSKLQFTNDGTVFKDIGSGSGSGSGINVISNSGFETGIADGWTSSGGTFAVVTSVNVLNGLQSASFQASATAQYFENTAVVIPQALYGQDCMAKFVYKGADANGYLTVMDGSSVELIPTTARAILSASTGTKTAKIYFTCPSSGSLKLRVQSTAAMAIGYFDEVQLGQADFVPTKQASFIGKVRMPSAASCTYTTTSTSLANFAVVSACNLMVPTGDVAAPATKIPAVVIPQARAGNYYFVATGNFQKFNAADAVAQFRFSDGTLHSSANSIRNSAAFSGVGTVTGNIVLPSDITNWQVQIQGSTTSGAVSAAMDNTIAESALEISVYFYPSGNDVAVNSKCANDIACENTFSLLSNSTGVVSNENLDFINGNCVVSDTSLYTCTFNAGIFTNAPNCVANLAADSSGVNQSASVVNNSSSTVVVRTLSGGGKIANPFTLSCQKTGADFKARQNIQGFLSSTVTSGSDNVRLEKVRIAGGTEITICSASPCSLYRSTAGISSVTRSSAGSYILNFVTGTFSSAPSCSYNANNNIAPVIAISGAATNTTYTLSTHAYSGGAPTDTWVDIICIGLR